MTRIACYPSSKIQTYACIVVTKCLEKSIAPFVAKILAQKLPRPDIISKKSKQFVIGEPMFCRFFLCSSKRVIIVEFSLEKNVSL